MEKDQALQKLGYTRKWIEYGFLDTQTLAEQIADIDDSIHDFPEHCRYSIFYAWIQMHHDCDIQDNELTHFFELVREDPDPGIAGSALGELLRAGKLNSQQIQRFEAFVPLFGNWLQRPIERAILLFELKQRPHDNSLIEKCLHHTDPVVQDYLFCHTSLPLQHLQILAEKGANKSIRNRARQKLKTKKPDSK